MDRYNERNYRDDPREYQNERGYLQDERNYLGSSRSPVSDASYHQSFPQNRFLDQEDRQRSRPNRDNYRSSRDDNFASSSRGSRSSGRFRGVGPKGYKRSDDRIREDVCDRLSDCEDLNAENISVKVEDGEVHLLGTVQDRQSKRCAEDCCESVSGAKDVINEIRIKSDNVRSFQRKSDNSSDKDTSASRDQKSTTARG